MLAYSSFAVPTLLLTPRGAPSNEDLVSFRKVAEVDVLLQSVNSLRPGTIQKLEVVAVCICDINVLSMFIIS